MIKDLRSLVKNSELELKGNVMFNRAEELLKLCELYIVANDSDDKSDFLNKESVSQSISRLVESCNSMSDDFRLNAAWSTVDSACVIAISIISKQNQ